MLSIKTVDSVESGSTAHLFSRRSLRSRLLMVIPPFLIQLGVQQLPKPEQCEKHREYGKQVDTA